MEKATDKAIASIKEYTDDPALAETLTAFMSEYPIGDEYGVLTETQWAQGMQFVEWYEKKGEPAFLEEVRT
jgi:hypothetical protein